MKPDFLKEDGYRHTYQGEGGSDRGLGGEDAGLGGEVVSRVKAARLILDLVSSSGVCWNRVAEKLPGWEGSR